MKYLTLKGFSVDVASRGEEAIEKAKESKFDLLILDIKLPDTLGDRVLREIRSVDEDIEVVMITGYPNLQDTIDLLSFRIHEILLKPVTTDELLRVACEALRGSPVDSSDDNCQVVIQEP
jgi:DNA-binding response OmpR family regulator